MAKIVIANNISMKSPAGDSSALEFVMTPINPTEIAELASDPLLADLFAEDPTVITQKTSVTSTASPSLKPNSPLDVNIGNEKDVTLIYKMAPSNWYFFIEEESNGSGNKLPPIRCVDASGASIPLPSNFGPITYDKASDKSKFVAMDVTEISQGDEYYFDFYTLIQQTTDNLKTIITIDPKVRND